jgi:glycosyltransferase involved in cell wall biosynthesis
MVIFDPLVSRFETRVLDRGDVAHGSAQARHNWNIDRISMSLADIVLADTGTHAGFYAEEFGIDREKIKILHLGYDDTVFSPQVHRESDGSVKILFYGSFLPLHGTDTIARAAGMLDRRFHFKIVGGGQTMGEFLRLAGEMGGASIDLVDSVPQEELPGLIAGADILLGVFGTTRKTEMVIPNKVFQAMACSRPVVTADTPAVCELFTPGKHIVTVPPGDAGSLAEALRRLSEDDAYARSVAETGGALVRESYNPERVAGRFLDILSQGGIS